MIEYVLKYDENDPENHRYRSKTVSNHFQFVRYILKIKQTQYDGLRERTKPFHMNFYRPCIILKMSVADVKFGSRIWK